MIKYLISHTPNFLWKSLLLTLLVLLSSCAKQGNEPINRYKVVNRYDVIVTRPDSLNPLTVGNGQFAFTVDITGLQSYPEFYERGIPLGTQSDWGWQTLPNPNNYTLADVVKYYQVGNDSVPYWPQFVDSGTQRQRDATRWLRENPHRIHLGMIGLEILDENGNILPISQLENTKQTLDLWNGVITSSFDASGVPVSVRTLSHQQHDAIAFTIESPLLKSQRIRVSIRFPFGNPDYFSTAYYFGFDEKHATSLIEQGENFAVFGRTMNNMTYQTRAQWEGTASFVQTGSHEYLIKPSSNNRFAMTVGFSPAEVLPLPNFASTFENNTLEWRSFWESGAAIDFEGSTDPRAFELERRIVLSQYLTKIQCTGPYPPQETGLTFNSWHGKFHLEMHWWHGMHFILWNRAELMKQQLEFYNKIHDRAKATASLQGFSGARWPKMICPEGRESPSSIGTFLIWQQPHIIYFAEALWKLAIDKDAVLKRYSDLVFSTAEFMASYARWDDKTGRYVLGPGLIPAQERFAPETTINPPFELAYWHFGLRVAQQWRERLGKERHEGWQHVINNLSPLPVQDGVFLSTEDATDSYTNPRYITDHPMAYGLLGFLPPSDFVNRDILTRTVDKVEEIWQWETIWGWDIPLAAMNATYLDRPEKAIDFLLMDTPKNIFLANGHNYQHSVLPIYLPGNGGLLAAIAMMASYRNLEGGDGFPDGIGWNVRHEGFPMILPITIE